MPNEARYSLIDIYAQPYLSDLHAAFDYWQMIKGNTRRFAASWQEFDLMQLPLNVVPRVCVLDVVPEGPDFLYRFWGTAITAMHHYDLTGQSVLNLTPEHFAACIWKQYCAVLETRTPLGFLTEVPLNDGRFSYYATVRFPLSSDGISIDKILSVEDYGTENGQLSKLFETVWLDSIGPDANV